MAFLNKNRTKPRQTATKKASGRNRVFLPWIEGGMFLFLILDIYILASLFSPWTGSWGRACSSYVLGNIGGTAIFPVLLAAYECVAFLFGRRIPFHLRQIAGTAILFLCTALLLGLLDLQEMGFHVRWLSPGKMGGNIAAFLYFNIGPLGTLLLGLSGVLLSGIFYGFIEPRTLIQRLSYSGREDRSNEVPIDRSEKVAVTEKRNIEQARSKIVSEDVNKVSSSKQVALDEKDSSTEKAFISIEETPYLNTITHESKEEKAESTDDIPSNVLSEVDMSAEDPKEESDSREADPEELDVSICPGQFPPPLDLFGPAPDDVSSVDQEIIKEQGVNVINTLLNFGVEATLEGTVVGPTVIQFQLQLAPGTKVSKVAGLSNDLAVSLAVPTLRVEAPIPGTPYVGIEIPNPSRQAVPLRSLLESAAFQHAPSALPLPVGLRVNGQAMVVGLEDLPHLLVAGTTGSGKSVFITSCITALCSICTPKELRLLLVDPKRVEMGVYEHLPHVLTKPVVEPKKAVHALGWAVREMEHRYDVFARARVKNLKSYNKKVIPVDRFPHIVIVVDELADLMFTAQKEVEDFICRLAQMARATGIHLMLATQRPSVNVITGLIKANIPARVAFTLPSQMDSRTIIDVSGAQHLLGRGDMLFVSTRYPRPIRVQSPFIDESRSIAFIDYLKNTFGEPEYIDIDDQENAPGSANGQSLDDPKLKDALKIVLETGIASASRLQRQMRVGFTRAARLIDMLEQMGIVGPQDGSKPREVYVDEERAREIMEKYGL